MTLSLSVDLFHFPEDPTPAAPSQDALASAGEAAGVGAKPERQVVASLARFYSQRGWVFVRKGAEGARQSLYERAAGWVALDHGPCDLAELALHREARDHVCGDLAVAALSVFAAESEYWGYELYAKEAARDRFVQSVEQERRWFPDAPSPGNPETIAALVPGLAPGDVAPYLVRRPTPQRDPQAYLSSLRALNQKPREGDLFPRFHRQAAVDFLRLLGAATGVDGDRARFAAKLERHFWLTKR